MARPSHSTTNSDRELPRRRTRFDSWRSWGSRCRGKTEGVGATHLVSGPQGCSSADARDATPGAAPYARGAS